MTPEEKAKSLYEAFYYKMPRVLSEKRKNETAITCAALCCREILENYASEFTSDEIYWQQVKEAIQKL
jgi:hypothetical protein